MLDDKEIRWVKGTTNELNNLLQVIVESSKVLEQLCNSDAETDRYFSILRNGVDRATRLVQTMVDRVGGYQENDQATPAPAATSPAPSAPVRTASGQEVSIFNPQGPLELLLVVDDEEYVTLLAQHALAESGYRVVTARDGMEAIEKYRRLKDEIALVILDFTMPVLDGADVFLELLRINPRAPVVLSSGFTEHQRVREMLSRGLRGFIPKPYTADKLLAQVRHTLETLKREASEQK